MKGLLSNAEFGKNVADNSFGYRASVKLRDGSDCHFYIRGCSIRRQTEPVGVDCRVYKITSAKQGSMLASRGYNGILSARYLIVRKEPCNNTAELF